MTRYRRLPMIVEAIQFDRTRPGYVKELHAFAPGCDIGPAHVTLRDGQRAEQGWWIVRDGLGTFTTVRDMTFRAQYEVYLDEEAT